MTRNVPSPFENATGSVAGVSLVGTFTSAMSALPSPLKSPTSRVTPGSAAQAAKFPTPCAASFVMQNEPMPSAERHGNCVPVGVADERDVVASVTVEVADHALGGARRPNRREDSGLAVRDLERAVSCLENAIGIVCQSGLPTSAISDLPSPSKSPTSFVARRRCSPRAAKSACRRRWSR